MKKIVIVFVAVFCVNSLIFSQDMIDVQEDTNRQQEVKVEVKEELRYFGSDNAFYLGNKRLSGNEMGKTLSSNPSALGAWEKGNAFKRANTGMKVATGVLIGVGGVVTIVSFSVLMIEAAATVAFFPLWLATNSEPPHSHAGAWLIAGVALVNVGIISGIMIPITKVSYKNYYSDAADTYNRGLQSKTAVSLHIGVTGNGFGLNLKF